MHSIDWLTQGEEGQTRQRNIVFSLYIYFCYLALVSGDIIIHNRGHERLSELKPTQGKENVVARIPSPRNRELIILEVGEADFSPIPRSLWWSPLPGIVTFAVVLWLRSRYTKGSLRGFLILAVFCVTANGANCWSRYSVGFDGLPSESVMVTAFFYGALFWFVDRFVDQKHFDSTLGAVKLTNKDRVEKLRILFDYAKNCCIMVVGVFLAVCITMAVNIFTGIKDEYHDAGISGLMGGWIIWLVFWGSLGLLGFIGAESARMLSRVVEALADIKESP